MRRRSFITLLGGAAAVWPLAARAQQGRIPVIGVLRPNRQHVVETFAEPFRRYMKAIGWEEGRNIRFLFVWTEGRNERAQALAGELVAQNVDLIITFGDPAIRAVQGATQAIPIVAMTDDMVGSGLVAGLARPGRNTTGVSILASELDVKRLEILHEVHPAGATDRCADRYDHDLDRAAAFKSRARARRGACSVRSTEPGRDQSHA